MRAASEPYAWTANASVFDLRILSHTSVPSRAPVEVPAVHISGVYFHLLVFRFLLLPRSPVLAAVADTRHRGKRYLSSCFSLALDLLIFVLCFHIALYMCDEEAQWGNFVRCDKIIRCSIGLISLDVFEAVTAPQMILRRHPMNSRNICTVFQEFFYKVVYVLPHVSPNC